MEIIKTYKFRLNPDEKNLILLKQHGGNSRFVWNQLVNFSKEYNKIHDKFPSQTILQKEIINIKKENEFLKLSHSQPLQIHAQRLNKTNFNSIKKETISKREQKIAQSKTKKQIAKAINYGKPSFKSKHNNSDSIFYPQNFKIRRSRIFVSKIGWISFKKHRQIEGTPKNLTIVQDGELWFVCIACEVKIKDKKKVPLEKANIVGIDLGTKSFATMSDGKTIENPRTLKKHLKKLKKQQKILSRRKIEEKEVNGKKIKTSSNNRTKQRIKVQKIHRKIRNIRRDFLHKTTHHLIINYDGFSLETLDIKGLLQKKDTNLNRSISDVSWFEFSMLLQYKSAWNFKHFVKVDQYFPSTKKCSQCGNIMSMDLEDRIYNCTNCDNCMDRDYNASLNIKEEGLNILSTLGNQSAKNSTIATMGIYACGQIAKQTGRSKKSSEQVVASRSLSL